MGKHTLNLNERDEQRKENLGATYKELVLKGLLFMEKQPQLISRIQSIESRLDILEKKLNQLDYTTNIIYKQLITKTLNTNRTDINQ